MRDLKLVLKRQWYEMIEAGKKLEEYREATPFWGKRLTDHFEWASALLASQRLCAGSVQALRIRHLLSRLCQGSPLYDLRD